MSCSISSSLPLGLHLKNSTTTKLHCYTPQRPKLRRPTKASSLHESSDDRKAPTASRRDALLSFLGASLAPLCSSSPLVQALSLSWTPPAEALAEQEECSFTVAPSGLAFCDRVFGSGNSATKGQLIKAHYVGRLESGKEFDNSYSRGRPLMFQIGVGEVIKGWDLGILGGDGVPPMLAGGKRTLKIPPGLAYGTRGAGCKGGSCVIPPDSTLLFEVEFIG